MKAMTNSDKNNNSSVNSVIVEKKNSDLNSIETLFTLLLVTVLFWGVLKCILLILCLQKLQQTNDVDSTIEMSIAPVISSIATLYK